ncbi:MAG TPA: cytochrome c [Saprospiraceae bacterium]|nr:cytochrome c [Saprospiraceae bacterium]
MKNCLLLLAGFSFGVLGTSCVYHDEETLYPPPPCDTAQVTYSLSVAPILQQNCYECHGGEATISGIPLEGYDNLIAADPTRVIGAIRHRDGLVPMPKDRDPLDECDIRKIEIWVAEGAQNN